MDREFERPKNHKDEPNSDNGQPRHNLESQTDPTPKVSHYSSPEEKIALFRSLFSGRQDVYALRWEGSGGSSGYQPVCRNLWKKGVCRKPRIKCSDCSNRFYADLTDQVIYDHLSGKITVGIYPLLEDESCRFLAADLDGDGWEEDAKIFRKICDSLSIPVYIERSRSGCGCHLWFFFEDATKASVARKLGFALLNRVLENRPRLGLGSYDRFFPNQDRLPKGGLGNLIALPLQGASRKEGNTVFLRDDFVPYADQWILLSSIERITFSKITAVLRKVERSSSAKSVEQPRSTNERHPEDLTVRIESMIRIGKDSLRPSLMNEILKLASFDNPEFFRAQAMRLPTYNKPRRINCVEENENDFSLPRGCLDDSLDILTKSGIRVNLIDNRSPGRSVEFEFQGELTREQDAAAREMQAHDFGILCAPTGSGKTVVGLNLIAKRRRNTLVLVHRRELLRQWEESAHEFLQISPEDIGQIGLGKNTAKGILDIALIQTLARNENTLESLPDYGYLTLPMPKGRGFSGD